MNDACLGLTRCVANCAGCPDRPENMDAEEESDPAESAEEERDPAESDYEEEGRDYKMDYFEKECCRASGEDEGEEEEEMRLEQEIRLTLRLALPPTEGHLNEPWVYTCERREEERRGAVGGQRRHCRALSSRRPPRKHARAPLGLSWCIRGVSQVSGEI